MPDGEGTKADTAYTLTVTAFYLLAIGANLWVLWDQYHDTPEGRVVAARVREARARFDQWAAPLRDRLHFRRAYHRLLWEAETVVPGSVVTDVEVEGVTGDDGGGA